MGNKDDIQPGNFICFGCLDLKNCEEMTIMKLDKLFKITGVIK